MFGIRVVLFKGVLVSALMVGAHGFADEEVPKLTASTGAVLPAPPINLLDCAKMGHLLLEYTNSGYRGAEPVEEGHPDRQIFEYENALAAKHYLECQVGQSHFQNPQDAFSKGFD